MGEDIHYQMFEAYYRRAAAAEENGQNADAKRLYLYAADSLLKSAKASDGDMKAAHFRRAEKLQALADLIEVPEPEKSGGFPDAGTDRRRAVPPAKEAEGREWVRSGKPDIRFSDIAGLEDAKESIRRRIILPRQHPDVYKAFRRNVKGGILLYGPPGTGKTMMAKAIAAEVDAVFYSIRCSDIVGKYFGESEKNIRSLFETARKDPSAVLFFDEFEALGAQRGGDSTVMNRLVPELLSQMDGFQEDDRDNIMVLAATNRPWDIDSAFLRPPRLTEKIYVGLPDGEARRYLVEKEFAEVPVDGGFDPATVVERTEGYNAADVNSLCETMKDQAIDRTIRGERMSPVTGDDLLAALEKVRSSVQERDISRIREWERQQGA